MSEVLKYYDWAIELISKSAVDFSNEEHNPILHAESLSNRPTEEELRPGHEYWWAVLVSERFQGYSERILRARIAFSYYVGPMPSRDMACDAIDALLHYEEEYRRRYVDGD